MLLLKNPQFLSDHYEILTKEGTHEDLILTEFRNDRVKIVDFLVKALFLTESGNSWDTVYIRPILDLKRLNDIVFCIRIKTLNRTIILRIYAEKCNSVKEGFYFVFIYY